MGTFSGGYMLDPATGRPVVGRTVAVTSWPDEVPLTPDGGAIATGPHGGYGRFTVDGVDVVQLRAGGVEQVLVSIEASLSGIGTSGSSNLTVVSGSVTLDDGVDVGTLVGYRATASTTFTGEGGSVALAAGAHIFERVSGGWTYRTIDEGTGLTPPAPDTTPPDAGTLAVTGVTDTAATLTVTGASDNQALHASPYAFSTNNGSTWSSWQPSNVYAATGLTPSTAYQGRHKVRDASGNEATGTAQGFTTLDQAPEPLPTGPVGVTHLYSGSNSATTAAQSYPAVPIGAASAHRLIVVATVALRTAPRTIYSATIGGVTATVANTASSAFSLNFAYAVVPTGTTADINITFSGTLDSGGSLIDVFEVTNTVKTHSASRPQSGDTPALIPASPAGGVGLLWVHRTAGSAPLDATGAVTELVDRPYTQGTVAAAQLAAYWGTATGSTIPVTFNMSGISSAAITFDKAV